MRLNGRPLLGRILGWVVSVLVVHAMLRGFLLARPDAFGHPMVGKLHWYLFHAWCFDLRSIVLGSLPFVAHVWFWESRRPRWAKVGLWSLVVVHSLLLPLAVADHELQRFMGSRLTISLLWTYGNPASTKEVFRAFLDDRGGVGLPVLLLVGSVPLALWLWKRIQARWRVAEHVVGWTAGLILAVVLGSVYTDLLWGGYNREQKLRPLVQVWWDEWNESRTPPMAQQTWRDLSSRWARQWRMDAGADSLWDFPDSSHPFWRVPRAERGNDTAPSRNVVLIVMESGRALNCGFLKPHGAVRDATPFLDSAARWGRSFTRHSCPSMPTVRALMSIHLGMPDHPGRNIATSFPALDHLSFPQILRREGWLTRFFSGADPAWDNETPWLGRWYDGFDYSSSRERDQDLFAHASEWMRGNLDGTRPFLVTIMTKSNHYPFDQDPAWRSTEDLQARQMLSMRYMDSCIGVFVGSLKSAPWYPKTTFVVTADHGFPLGEHGPGNMGSGLYSESTWLPLVVWGDPKLERGEELGPTSHLDLAPSILAWAGVRKANHFAGHDLSRAMPAGRATWSTHYDELLCQTALWKAHGTISGVQRERGAELFRADLDPRELADSSSGRKALLDSLVESARWKAQLATEVIVRDALVSRER